MQNALKMMLEMSLLGGISSGIGGFLGGVVRCKNKVIVSSLFQITAGIMTGIVCLDMLPESFEMANIMYSIFGIILGIATIFIIDLIVKKYNKNKEISKNKYSLMSLVIMFSMALHNMIEGLAIGSGMMYSASLGISILISIFLHDIPEGMVVGVTNNTNNQKLSKVVLNSILVGMAVGIGVFIGQIVGSISNNYISLSLSFAAGAMLYIVSCDLIPSSNEMSGSTFPKISYILGIMIGGLIT